MRERSVGIAFVAASVYMALTSMDARLLKFDVLYQLIVIASTSQHLRAPASLSLTSQAAQWPQV